MRAAWPPIRNILKAWVLLLGLCAALGLVCKREQWVAAVAP